MRTSHSSQKPKTPSHAKSLKCLARWASLAFGLLGVLAFAPETTRAVWQAQVDARVLADTASGATGNFLIVLQAQTATRTLVTPNTDRAQQGRIVFDALRANAATTQASVRAHLDALGAPYRVFYVANVIAASGNRAVVNALAARNDVLAIESDRAFRVPLEENLARTRNAPSGVEWGVSRIHAPALWNLGFTGQGIVYANADTGVQWDHPALRPHYRGWNGVSANHNLAWWDAIHSDVNGNHANACGFSLSAPCDDHGHGTHTTGTSIGDDGAGNQIGVAPGAQWIACRNMDEGWGTPSTYIECLEFFLAPWDLNRLNADPSRRPDVVGNSYVCPPVEGCAPLSLQTAVDNLRAAGVFMAISAGNEGSNCATVQNPPAIYDSAITVGATDAEDAIAGFSSRGPVAVDGSNRRKPDLVAPGVSVRSAYPGNGYTTLSGTSMAAPHVAGAVALLWSAFPTLRRNVNVTESILTQSAMPLVTAQTCGGDAANQFPNHVYGSGRLDVLAAYRRFAEIGLPPYNFHLPATQKSQ